MKVEKIDYLWAILSFITVGVSFHYGVLLGGLLIIYGMMCLTFLYHIYTTNKRLSNTEAAYGKITEIRTDKSLKTYYCPVVEYETANGRKISSVYAYPDKKNRYNVGDEELICYDLDDPVFFYFANRADELTNAYYKYILYGSIPAIGVLLTMMLMK